MKKTLNESSITNELRHGSSFFREEKSIEQDENTVFKQPSSPNARTNVTSVRDDRPFARPYERTESTPPKRETKRHPFEIYKDQLDRLKRLKAQAMLDGATISMSDMVRVALDNYLQDHD